MKKHIYKLNNRVNRKAYIGQTTDIERRWREHRNSANEGVDGLLYDDMRAYGINNFTMEVLEWNTEDYNNREEYYIDLYNTLYPNGYNRQKGGGCQTVRIQDCIEDIIDALQNSDMQMQSIAKFFHIGKDTLNGINLGKKYRQDGVEYPIRDNDKLYRLSLDRIKQIQYSLQYELDKSLSDIQKEYELTRATLYHINYGDRLIYQLPGKTYPLRGADWNRRKVSSSQREEIIELLKDTALSQEDIARRYDVSCALIENINAGKKPHHVDGIAYPIRELHDTVCSRRACLSPNELREVERALRDTNESITSIARRFEITSSTIRNINSGKTKKYYNPNAQYPLRPIKCFNN